MSKTKPVVWIIGEGGSDADGVSFTKFYGTEAGVKKEIMKILKAYKANDKESYDCGTEKASDLRIRDGKIYGYVWFSDYYVDVEAVRLSDIPGTDA